MPENLTVYNGLLNLNFNPATLALIVTQQLGYDRGSPEPDFYPAGGEKAVLTAIPSNVAKPMLYKSGLQTFADLGLTGDEPMIQIILTMVETAKAAASGQS